MTDYKLEPCGCGSLPKHCSAYVEAERPTQRWVECSGQCRAMTVCYDTRRDASHAWNQITLADEMETMLRDQRDLGHAVETIDALLARISPVRSGS